MFAFAYALVSVCYYAVSHFNATLCYAVGCWLMMVEAAAAFAVKK